MKIIRPITVKDLDAFEKIAFASAIGMTSIPKNRQELLGLIKDSIESFSKKVEKPVNEAYLFVLEDLESKEIGGVCGIYSKTGVVDPVYSYRIEKRAAPHTPLRTPKFFTLLYPNEQWNGPSELCSLYLLSSFRKGGLGKLLSFSRLLFIASFRQRFDDTIYAEIRGYIDQNHDSPFWKGLGSKFLNLSFQELNELLNGRRNFFLEGLPQFPIYTTLLSQVTQKTIGKTHVDSKKALAMLTEEGFHLTNRINPIDAGPIIEAQVASLRTVLSSKVGSIEKISPELPNGKEALIANLSLDYRCAMGKVEMGTEGQIVVEKELAGALNAKVGEPLRYILRQEILK